MSSVDEVVIRAILKDELSRPLGHVRSEVQRLDKQMVGAQRATNGFSGSLTHLHNQSILANSGVRKMSMSLASFTGQGLRTATLGLGGLGLAAVGFGLKASASFEQSRIAFGTLLGSVQAGNALFDQLQKFNLQTPFGLGDISGATNTLLQFGFTADNVMTTLKGISDVAASSGANASGNLGSIALALGQINSAGVLRAQDLNQLVQAGFPAYKLLTDITGQTAADIRKQMESGLELPAQKFIEAVQQQQGVLAQYAGGAAAQAKTLSGVWSNFMDMLRTRLATAMQPLADSLNLMLPKFSDSLGRFIDQAAPAMSQIAIQLLDMLTTGLPTLQALVAPVLNAISLMLASPQIAQIGQSLADFVTAFVPQIPVLVTAFLALADVIPPLVDIIARALALLKPVSDATNAVSKALHALLSPFTGNGMDPGGAGALLGGASTLLNPGANVFQNKATDYVSNALGRGGATTPIVPPVGGAGGSVVNMNPGAVVVNNPAAHIDVARAVQQGIDAHEQAKTRRR